MLLNTVSEPLDIIVIAGQSNAEGYGLGPTDTPYTPTPRILEMHDVDNQGYAVDEKSRGTFNIRLPRTYLIGIAEERRSCTGRIGCLANRFAELYAAECLAPGRRVLILRAAVGATGFAKNNWGVGDVLYERLLRMCTLALSMNKENRISALLWHQGEQDAIFRPHLTDAERESTYIGDLSALIEDFSGKFGEIPFIMGGFNEEWAATEPHSAAVARAQERVAGKFSKTALVSSAGLPTNNAAIGNGDIYHFSRNSLTRLGERYFDAYRSL